MYSCWLYFLPPRGVTLARVPSMILSSACCTPSPPTSRVARRRVALAGDLVDLVDVDDAARGLLHVVVGVVEQVLDDVLDVLADVAGLGEAGGVGDGEGDVEEARQRLGEQRLAGAGGADEQDVRLLELDVLGAGARLARAAGGRGGLLRVDALVVVVDGDREDLLRAVLADHVVVEEALDLGGRGQRDRRAALVALRLLRDDVVAEPDALVADVDGGPGDELADLALPLAAEGAATGSRGGALSGSRFPSSAGCYHQNGAPAIPGTRLEHNQPARRTAPATPGASASGGSGSSPASASSSPARSAARCARARGTALSSAAGLGESPGERREPREPLRLAAARARGAAGRTSP